MDNNLSFNIGDIIYVSLEEEDGLVLNKGFSQRKKYIVIIGFTSQGYAIGALLVNSHIAPFKRSIELFNSQYPLLVRHYRDFLLYDSWLDCSDIFELSINRILSKGGRRVGSLIKEDLERILNFLRETDLFDKITKRRFGLIKD